MNHSESFLFKHMNKFIVAIFAFCVLFWIAASVLGFIFINEVSEHGLKDVVERVWEGPDE